MASKHGIFSYSVGPHSVLSTLCVLNGSNIMTHYNLESGTVETRNIVRSHVHVYSVCLQFIEVLGSRPWQVKNGDYQQFRERKLLGIPGNDFKVSIKSGNGRIYGCCSEARLHTPDLQK